MPRNHSHHTILLQYGWVTIRNKTWFETSPIRQDSTEKQNYQYFTFRWLVDKKRTNVYKGCDPPPLHKPLPTTTACHYHGSAIDTAKYWSHTARALTQHVAQPEATSSSSPSPSRNLDESVAPVTGVKPGSQLLHEQRWSTCQYKTAPQSAPSSVRLRGTRSKEVGGPSPGTKQLERGAEHSKRHTAPSCECVELYCHIATRFMGGTQRSQF